MLDLQTIEINQTKTPTTNMISNANTDLHADKLHPAGVERGRNPDLDLLGEETGLEAGLDDDLDLQLGASHLPDQRDNTERQREILQ